MLRAVKICEVCYTVHIADMSVDIGVLSEGKAT